MDIKGEILRRLPYVANEQQDAVAGALARFVTTTTQEAVFVLNGYAGTGKTSLVGALVGALPAVGLRPVLLAPTGRAAKVLSAFAGRAAWTIHRLIYRHAATGPSGYQRDTAENRMHDAVFIVDEASMIGGGVEDGNNLLEDLIHYVYSGVNCRMLLVGDTAQLPPVGSPFSPAMDTETLHSYGLRVVRATLTAVARQASESGILYNATWLRRAMRQNPLPEPLISTAGFDDVRLTDATEMPDDLSSAYGRDGVEETIVVTRSNKRAAGFNAAIRAQVLGYEEELVRGELLMVTHNNYFWTRSRKDLDFLANGDMVRVEAILGTEERYGLRFADVKLAPTDGREAFKAKIMLDGLRPDGDGFNVAKATELYLMLRDDGVVHKDNPYWNALQVRYAYAVTCHKAQGGQWANVFVDAQGIGADQMGEEFYRWLYTAVTRARRQLFILGAQQW